MRFLSSRTGDSSDLQKKQVIRCGMEFYRSRLCRIFLCGIMDLFPGALRGIKSAVPMILSDYPVP